MKTIFIILTITFNSYNVLAQDFSYKNTQDKSVSKYHRIGHIEDYLLTLEDKLSKLKSDLKSEDKKSAKELEKRLNQMDKELLKVKTEVQTIKNDIIPQLQKKIEAGVGPDGVKEAVEENKLAIKDLKGKFESLNNVLKSLNEFLNVDKEVKKAAPKGKSP